MEYLRRNGWVHYQLVASSLALLHEAKQTVKIFVLPEAKSGNYRKPEFFKNKSKAIDDNGYIALDTYYYWALAKTDQAMNLLPVESKETYQPSIQNGFGFVRDSQKIA